jgi:acetate---CoA ligase (ADP-forming)
MTSLSSIEPLIAPLSIAIIGASDDPTKIGGRPIAYLKQAAFAGPIYPVNPSRTIIQGLRSFPSIGAVPGGVDCAIIAVAADHVEDTVHSCCLRGVRSVVVFSSGFAETGPEGRQKQDRLSELARNSGIRILGPNVVGLYNAASRAFMTFSGAVRPVIGEPTSRISIVSQSGGYAGYLLALAEERCIRFGKWISTGNEADVDVAEVMGYLAADPETDVILAYIEGVKRGDRFVEALERARRDRKIVIVLKVGRSEGGSAAAASHTASLAGSDPIFRGLCRQYGAIRASTATEMLDFAYAAVRPRPLGRRLGVLTVSGGVGVEIADLAEDHGLQMPEVPFEAQEKLRALVPFAATRNPVDVTAQITNDPSLLEKSLEVLTETKAFDALFVFLGHAAAFPELADKFAAAVARVRATNPEQPIVLCALGSSGVRRGYESAGCLVYREPAPAVAALSAVLSAFETISRPASPERPAFHYPKATERLNEFEGKRLLSKFGITGPVERVARTPSAAGDAADSLGYPVAVKVLSRDILHKSDVGGVELRLTSRSAVEAAANRILDQISRLVPAAQVDGVIVSRMAKPGIECIVGLHHDPTFGPGVMMGLGGTAVELWRDVSFRLAPFGEDEARVMVTELRSFPLLDGYRGAPRADVASLIRTLASLSRLPWQSSPSIFSVEINPLLVLREGEGAMALDAVVACALDSDSMYHH